MDKKIYFIDDIPGKNKYNTLLGRMMTCHNVKLSSAYNDHLGSLFAKYGDTHVGIDNDELLENINHELDILCDEYVKFCPDIIITRGVGSLIAAAMLSSLKTHDNKHDIIFINPVMTPVVQVVPKVLSKYNTVWIHGRHNTEQNFKYTVQGSQKTCGLLILTNDDENLRSLENNNLLMTLIDNTWTQ